MRSKKVKKVVQAIFNFEKLCPINESQLIAVKT